jgi:hypothetical protein
MPTVTLTDEPLQIPRALNRVLAEAHIASVSHAAKVFDGDAAPALLLIAGGELTVVTRQGVQRWLAAELERVDDHRIVPVHGDPVPIRAWYQASRRAPFLHAVRDLLGQPQPPPAPMPVSTHPERVSVRRPATIVAILSAIVAAPALATVASSLFGRGLGSAFLAASVVLAAVAAIPLLVYSLRLAARESRWWPLALLGVIVGGVGVAVLALALLYAAALGVTCAREGCRS